MYSCHFYDFPQIEVGLIVIIYYHILSSGVLNHAQFFDNPTGLDIAIYLILVTLGSPLLGYVMARISILWLSHVYNDAVVEITITLATTYITYYIGEVFLKASGVLAVAILGIEMNKRRTNISPQVDAFLHK